MLPDPQVHEKNSWLHEIKPLGFFTGVVKFEVTCLVIALGPIVLDYPLIAAFPK